ncbi:tyrosine-type recombinase/integrase [Klenkia taihuensis]|uniref:tyrosine-type recombinase/integrase n=1 Tax=Klenkia taihuensis TaxID=1225127 RepID=UPI0010424CC4|nr:site-specific integrase [Klenkia taihuensis]
MAEVSYRDELGKLRRRRVYGSTQTEARRKQRVVREALQRGTPIKPSTTSVASWIETWINGSLAASDRRQSTIDLYTAVARRHLVPDLGQRRLDHLRPSDIEALVVAKRKAGLAPSTVRTIYTVLRAALDIAVRDGLMQSNPAVAVRRPSIGRREADFLTPTQARSLLDALEGERIEPVIRLLLATGLRRGEALALHWADIDLESRILRIRWTLTRTSVGLVLGEPKTDKSRRSVSLPGSAVDLLREHRSRQADERRRAGDTWVEQDFVFTTEIGTPLEPRNVLRRFGVVARRAGLPGAHLHTLRHSAASFLLAAGVHIKVVQEHLGHSSFAITADIYSHVTSEQSREAADHLDRAVDWSRREDDGDTPPPPDGGLWR